MESLALSDIEWVDDIFGYDWGAQASLLAKAFGAGLSVSAASRNIRYLRQQVSLALIYELRDLSIFLGELSDAVIVAVKAVDRMVDQPGAEHDEAQVQEQQRHQ